jgi:hypothetical protein
VNLLGRLLSLWFEDLIERAPTEYLTFGLLMSVLTDGPEWAGGQVLLEASEDPLFGGLIRESYLPILAPYETPPVDAVGVGLEPARAPEEWVSVIPIPGGNAVTIPEDSSPTARFSLFVRLNGLVRRISAETTPDTARLIGVSLSAGRHCGFPDRLRCEPGTCNACRLELREVPPRGWVCICPHQP